MALSTREVFLVLRARDEATRTIARVSHAMSGMDRRAVTSSGQMIDTQRANIRALSAQIGDVNNQYSRTIADAYALHRRQTDQTNQQFATVRNNIRAVQDEYVTLSRVEQDRYRAGRIDAATYRTNMTNLQRLRQDQLRGLTAEKDAIADVSRANSEAYHRRVTDARNLHIQQKENIRLEKLNAEQIIRSQQEIIDAENMRRANLRDQGARLQAIGGQAVYAGATMAAMGAAGVYAFSTTVASAIEYEQAARRTLTQVDNNRIKLNQVADAGKRIADEVPVAFEQIQPAMYDVFSSIDVGLRGATKLTKQFARDAVGGTTDMETATRANLAIMNAYGIKVEEVGKVSDFMFQLVRKGVGSYDEFAKTIGRAIPSAARAGQTYHTLGAMMAFMTRNGVSTAMAATSSARALDAISHTKTVDKLEEMGIQVKNLKGEFLPLPDILEQMEKKFEGLSRPELAKKLYELFKSSGGTIQARRFFDMYFKQSDEFKQRVREMADTAGEAEKAFNKMADSPQAKLQALKNDWMLLRIEMGENLMPIAMRVVDTLNDWIDAFQRLTPEQQETITKTLAIGAALTALIGVLTMVGGAVLVFVGSVKMLGITAGMAVGKIGFLSIGLAGLATGFFKIVTASSDADRAVGVAMTAMSGAIMGFAVGGPIGAAIGGAAGLVGGLIAAVASSGDTARAVSADWSHLADTLNAVSGATTAATRAAVYDEAQRSGLFDSLKNENITRRQIVDGIMEEGNSRNRLAGIMAVAQANVDRMKQKLQALNEVQRSGSAPGARGAVPKVDVAEMHKLSEAIKLEEARIKAIQDGIGTLRADQAAQRQRSAAITDFSSIVKKVPPKVITQFKMGNMPSSLKEVLELQRRMKLTPKEVKTIMKFLGIEGTKDQIDQVQKKIKDLHNAKPDLTGFITGVERGARNAAQAAERGGDNVAKALKQTTGKSKADLNGFKASVTSGAAAAVGPASIGGASVGNALKQGVISGFAGTQEQLSAQAASAVRAAVAAARNAADAHSPSRKMYDLGKDMADGLRIGWDHNVEAFKPKPAKDVSAMVRKLVAGMTQDMKTVDPSWAALIDNARTFIEQKFDRMRDALEKKLKKMDLKPAQVQKKLDQFDNRRGKKQKSLLEDIRKATEKDFARLTRVIDRLQEKVKELDEQKAKLDDMRAQRDSYQESVRSAITSFGSFSSFGQQTDVFGNVEAVSLGSIQTNIHNRLATVQAWGAALRQLLANGFSKEIYDMVVQLGPEAGLEYANALLTAAPADVAILNHAVSTMNAEAAAIAATAAGQMYNVGIQAQESLVAGLESRVAELQAQATQIATNIATTIEDIIAGDKMADKGRKLGGQIIKGMQERDGMLRKVGKEIGEGVSDGVVKGLDDKDSSIRAAVVRLADSISDQLRRSLRIHSPSKVGVDIGANVGGAIGLGLARQTSYVESMADRIARVLAFDPDATYSGRMAGYKNSGYVASESPKQINQEINVTTQEIDPVVHAQQLGWELASRYGV